MEIDETSMRTNHHSHPIPIPNDAARRAQWIIGELKLAGSSLAAIALELNCSRQAGALALRMGSQRWEAAIASKLGRSLHELFPDRYDKTGRRLRQTRGVTQVAA